ncbi:MAG: hypothetical protein ABSG28_11145 [Methanoregula sp.]|uniref:hypothetical protein n=1 Tax=Methanoregula sp. TaxID=2052170 RepID=UPI003C1F0D66
MHLTPTKELRKPTLGRTSPEWRASERESSKMHHDNFINFLIATCSDMYSFESIPLSVHPFGHS